MEVPKQVEQSYQTLLANNRRWVAACRQEDPEYFEKIAAVHDPKFLWIGCADSRVPANVITGTNPGEVFVHRNIANVVVHTDTSMLAVLQYAVEHLKVEHIIVCGHYGCGGIEASLKDADLGLINVWLQHLKDTYRLHSGELRAYTDKQKLARRMVELNVIEGVYNLGKSAIVQRAWHQQGFPEIHGWVYDLHDGLIRDLGVNFSSPDALEENFRYRFDGPAQR